MICPNHDTHAEPLSHTQHALSQYGQSAPRKISGFAHMAGAAYQAKRQHQRFSGLPEGCAHPKHLLDILRAAGRELPFSRRALDVLAILLDFSALRDWQGEEPPLVWPSNEEIAGRMGCHPATINRLLRELRMAGAIIPCYGPGNRRYPLYDGQGNMIAKYGISLAPLPALVQSLQHVVRQAAHTRRQWRFLHGQATSCWQKLCQHQEALAQYEEIFGQGPKSDPESDPESGRQSVENAPHHKTALRAIGSEITPILTKAQNIRALLHKLRNQGRRVRQEQQEDLQQAAQEWLAQMEELEQRAENLIAPLFDMPEDNRMEEQTGQSAKDSKRKDNTAQNPLFSSDSAKMPSPLITDAAQDSTKKIPDYLCREGQEEKKPASITIAKPFSQDHSSKNKKETDTKDTENRKQSAQNRNLQFVTKPPQTEQDRWAKSGKSTKPNLHTKLYQGITGGLDLALLVELSPLFCDLMRCYRLKAPEAVTLDDLQGLARILGGQFGLAHHILEDSFARHGIVKTALSCLVAASQPDHRIKSSRGALLCGMLRKTTTELNPLPSLFALAQQKARKNGF